MLMSSLQNIHWKIGIHIKKTCRANLLFLLMSFFVEEKLDLVIILFSTLNKVNE